MSLFSGTTVSKSAQLFPLISPFFVWMLLANIPSKESPLAHHSLSPEQQSVCTHVAKPWPFLSILLTRMLSSLVCSFLNWWTYFRNLVLLFHICLWCDGRPWGPASSLVFKEPLQRLCEICCDHYRHTVSLCQEVQKDPLGRWRWSEYAWQCLLLNFYWHFLQRQLWEKKKGADGFWVFENIRGEMAMLLLFPADRWLPYC